MPKARPVPNHNQRVYSRKVPREKAMCKTYTTLWRNKWLTTSATSLPEMAEMLRTAADTLDEMAKNGVALIDNGGIEDDYAMLVTTDSAVAKKYRMEEGE